MDAVTQFTADLHPRQDASVHQLGNMTACRLRCDPPGICQLTGSPVIMIEESHDHACPGGIAKQRCELGNVADRHQWREFAPGLVGECRATLNDRQREMRAATRRSTLLPRLAAQRRRTNAAIAGVGKSSCRHVCKDPGNAWNRPIRYSQPPCARCQKPMLL